MRENGLRAADQPAREVDVTVEMQRKVRHAEFSDFTLFQAPVFWNMHHHGSSHAPSGTQPGAGCEAEWHRPE